MSGYQTTPQKPGQRLVAGVSFRSPVSRELHLQPEVPDERGLAVHPTATYDAAAGHEKDEQAPVKLISPAQIEGGGTRFPSQNYIIVNFG